jgi:predicted glycogen debranching enzyme
LLIDGEYTVQFGRSICGELGEAERREWLVTNGLGGFASGTIAGTLTRRYHGLLIAALRPPAERMLLVAKTDESVLYGGAVYELAANRWKDDFIAPRGFTLLERFYLDGTTPVWHYAMADALLEKRIWMEPGANTSYVRYRLLRAASPLELRLRALVNYRDFHGNTHAGDREMEIAPVESGLRIDASPGAHPFWLRADRGAFEVENVWYRDFILSQETLRGLDDRDDHLSAGRFTVTLAPNESVTLIAGLEDQGTFLAAQAEMAWGRRVEHEAAVIAAWARNGAAEAAPAWLRQCVLAADQFLVASGNGSEPRSVIAGYHWFGAWGRDTMIALPGLTLTTGRTKIAQRILTAFAAFVDQGMLPNFFPENGEPPLYDTVDAALWYIEAAARYFEATGDRETLTALWPVLQSVIDGYRSGARHGIHMDDDGLIATGGGAAVGLTWMDAKAGDQIVTPRVGKPIEISALWYNALQRMTRLGTLLDKPVEDYDQIARTAATGFDRFWNAECSFCYDVLDGPNGDDATLRPNQIFAVALPHCALSPERQRGVVASCAALLLTSNGLRTLPPADPRFVGQYAGSPTERDVAYHEGTAWPWLLGPFAVAYARAYGDALGARAFLDPLADQVGGRGLGSISEVADGTAPFAAGGAIAQAWSVAELLRAWHELSSIVRGE